MQDFLKYFADFTKSYPMHLEIYYSKTLDWRITIWRKGCGENGEDIIICDVQDCDAEYVFAKAHIALKDWLRDNIGGS